MPNVAARPSHLPRPQGHWAATSVETRTQTLHGSLSCHRAGVTGTHVPIWLPVLTAGLCRDEIYVHNKAHLETTDHQSHR